MKVIIEEEKMEKMSELTEKILKYGGKLMSCIEELEEGMSERGGGSMGSRYNNRGSSQGNRDEDWDDEDMMQRRRRR